MAAAGDATTRFTYSDEDLVRVDEQSGDTTAYSYDSRGNLITVVASGGTTRFVYEERSNVTGVRTPDGSSTAYDYDRQGRVVSRRDGELRTTVYTCDSRGNLLQASSGETADYSYSRDDSLVRVSRPMERPASRTTRSAVSSHSPIQAGMRRSTATTTRDTSRSSQCRNRTRP
jgi:YD repeat-containing protein